MLVVCGGVWGVCALWDVWGCYDRCVFVGGVNMFSPMTVNKLEINILHKN